MGNSPAERIKKLAKLEALLSRENRPVLLPAALGLAELFSLRALRIERAAGQGVEALWLLRGERRFRSVSFPINGSVSESVWNEQKFRSFEQVQRRFGRDGFIRELKFDFYSGLPVLDDAGAVRMVWSFFPSALLELTEDEIAILLRLAERVLPEMEKSPAVAGSRSEELLPHNRELELVNAITAAAGEVLEDPAQLERALTAVATQLGAETGLVFSWDEAEQKLFFSAGSGARPKAVLAGASRTFGSFLEALQNLQEGIWGSYDLRKSLGCPFWQAAAMGVGEKNIGVFILAGAGAIPSVRPAVLETAVRQLTLALERVTYFQQEKRRMAQLETLSQVATRIAGFLSLDELLPYLVGLLHDHFGYYQVHIFLLDDETGELVVMAGKGVYHGAQSTVGQRLSLGRGINGRVARLGKPVLANDVSQEPAFHYVKELPDTRSELTVPIKAEGRVLGTLDVQSALLNAFSPADVMTLQIVADQVGIAVTNARLFEKSRKQNLRLSILNRLSVEIASARGRKEVLALVLESARKLLSSAHALILLASERGLELFPHRLGPEELHHGHRLAAVLSGAPELVGAWTEKGECRYLDSGRPNGWPLTVAGALEDMGLGRFFCAPLISREGKLLALLLISAENTHESPEVFLRLVQAYAHQSQTALENAFLIEELIESEAKFTDLYENAPDMYQTLDSSGVVLACNRTQERMLGIPKTEILGRPFVDWIHPESKAAWRAHVEEVTLSAEESSCPVRLALPGGELLDADAHSRRVALPDGQIWVRTVLRDVTEKRKLEHQLLQSQKMESVGTLAAGVAHEFNNFLGGIMGYASLGAEMGHSETMKKNLEQIIRVTRQAQKMVQQLLSFSKRVGEETWLPVDLEKVLKEAVGLAGQELRQKEVKLELEAEKIPPLQGHHGQLVQVFLNLLLNAIHAVSPRGNISVSAVRSGDLAKVRVADTGCGISPENLSKIFDPFFSTKGVYGDGSQPGAGLGLTICYNVVKAHGGEIEVESEVGRGTTFTLTFPLAGQLTPTPKPVAAQAS